MKEELQTYLAGLHSLYPGLSDTVLLTVDDSRRPPAYHLPEGTLAGTRWAYSKPDSLPMGVYRPRNRNEHNNACIWVDHFVYGARALDETVDFTDPSNINQTLTDQAFAARSPIAVDRVQIAVLHEFSHHFDIESNAKDTDNAFRENDFSNVHDTLWEAAYKDVIERAFEAALLTDLQRRYAYSDLDLQMGRQSRYGLRLWQEGEIWRAEIPAYDLESHGRSREAARAAANGLALEKMGALFLSEQPLPPGDLTLPEGDGWEWFAPESE